MEKVIENTIKELADAAARTLDYEIAWIFAEQIGKHTIYKGKGRPKKTDYIILKHPFDGKLKYIL